MNRRQTHIVRLLLYILLAGVALLMVGPFVWMLIVSVTPHAEVVGHSKLIPSSLALNNYNDVVTRFPFGLFTFNSFKIACLSTLGTLFSASLAGYAFARMEFKGKKLFYWIVLAAMMVPFQVTMIPVFYVLKQLGMMNSHAALTVPSFFGFGMGAFGVFLLRQFFMTVPKELEEAAIMDGAGRFRIYWRIMLPMAKPALATLGVLTFMSHWNDLLGPVLYLSSPEKMTLTYGLASLQGGDLGSNIELACAGAALSIVPILFLYVFAQRFFVQGITAGAVKE